MQIYVIFATRFFRRPSRVFGHFHKLRFCMDVQKTSKKQHILHMSLHTPFQNTSWFRCSAPISTFPILFLIHLHPNNWSSFLYHHGSLFHIKQINQESQQNTPLVTLACSQGTEHSVLYMYIYIDIYSSIMCYACVKSNCAISATTVKANLL